jgi:hypothetical protein
MTQWAAGLRQADHRHEMGSGWGRPFSPAFTSTSSASVTGSSKAEGGKALLEQRVNGMATPQQGAVDM